MKNTIKLITFAIFAISFSTQIYATPVCVTLTAKVARIDDSNGILSGKIKVNDIINGTYNYDSTTVDSNDMSTVGDYRYSTTPFGITLNIGNYVFRTNPNNVDFLIEVVNNYNGSDNYLIRSYNNIFSVGQNYNTHISWQLDDSTSTALSNDKLPASPPILAKWQSIFGLDITSDNGFDGFVINAHVTSTALCNSTLNMDDARCRYIAPVYNSVVKLMKTQGAVSCKAAVNNYTWLHKNRLDNEYASSLWSNQLKGVDNSVFIINRYAQEVDEQVSNINLLWNDNLIKIFTHKEYINSFIKKKGILDFLTLQTKNPFKDSSIKGRYFNEVLKEALQKAGGNLCGVVLNSVDIDNEQIIESCKFSTETLINCGLSYGKDMIGLADCAKKTSNLIAQTVNTGMGLIQEESIRHHINEYILINNYVDDYFANGRFQIPNDSTQLENDILNYAVKYDFTRILDYDMDTTQKGILTSINSTMNQASIDVKNAGKIQKIFGN